MRRLTHTEFCISIPRDWSDGTIITLYGPEHEGVFPTILLSRVIDPGVTTAQELAIQQLRDLLSTFRADNLTIIEEEMVKVGNEEAYKRSFSYGGPDAHTKIIQVHFYLVHQGTGYIIIATDDAVQFEGHWPMFERIISTFRFVAV